MRHGDEVTAFEQAFASQVGAAHAVAMTNGTVTLQVALMALGVQPGDRVATTPLTMAATTIAILNAGAVPIYCDVNPGIWIKAASRASDNAVAHIPVSLYGLSLPFTGANVVDDAAQTLRQHSGAAFTSYSLQRSKIISTGEGGVLVTNDVRLADDAREIASLGYKMGGKARINAAVLKSPTYDRHHRRVSLNARMNDVTAALGLTQLERASHFLAARREAASYYRDAIAGCDWLTPQHVPEGWTHDYWCYAVACDTPERALWLAEAVVRHGGERPYAAWKLTYQEPAFRHLGVTQIVDDRPSIVGHPEFLARICAGDTISRGLCPVAESLQPRLLQFQTNNLASAEQNAKALRAAIYEQDLTNARHRFYAGIRARPSGVPCG